MKKSEQIKINGKCMDAKQKAINELIFNRVNSKRLRTCNAIVFDTPNYYILQSYSTIVAVIDKNTDTLYDFLRIVYGFTRTSAQHISKFNHDYCGGMWGCKEVYTAR